jgi:hypothetical protein
MFVARNLERIADHTTNIAEDVIFLVRGVDVRHHHVAERQILNLFGLRQLGRDHPLQHAPRWAELALCHDPR